MLLLVLVLAASLVSCDFGNGNNRGNPPGSGTSGPETTEFSVASSEFAGLVQKLSRSWAGDDRYAFDITITDDVEDLWDLWSGLNNLYFDITLDLSASVSADYIPQNFMKYNNHVKKVTLPPNTTQIDNYAFAYAGKLEELRIPEFVVKLGASIIIGTAVKAVEVPAGVKKLDYTFEEARNLETVVLHEGL